MTRVDTAVAGVGLHVDTTTNVSSCYYNDCLTLAGEQMRVASGEFASDPCSTMKRGAMVRAARALLSSVTRLLIIADMVDVHLMLKSLRIVCSFVQSFVLPFHKWQPCSHHLHFLGDPGLACPLRFLSSSCSGREPGREP